MFHTKAAEKIKTFCLQLRFSENRVILEIIKVNVHIRTGHEGPEEDYRWSTPRPDRFNPGKEAVPIS